MKALEAALTQYVDALVENGAVTSKSVERALREVQRHRFLDSWYRLEAANLQVVFRPVDYDRDHPTPEQLEAVYSNQALVTVVEHSMPASSTSKPSLVACMLELLGLRPGMQVLEVGTGTGYNAALLAKIVGPDADVYTVEFLEDVAERASDHLRAEGHNNVQVFHRDGYIGVPEAAPFDRIVATVGCSDISPCWIEQLKPNGSMLIPLQHSHFDPLVEVHRNSEEPHHAVGRIVGRSGFMPIQGKMHWVNPWRSARISGMPTTPLWSRRLPDSLLPSDGEASVYENRRHRGFHFFLTLASRDHWFTNRGYGLADTGTGSALVVTTESVEGFSATGHGKSLESLHERFVYLCELWEQLGCRHPEEYALSFVPKSDPPVTEDDSGMIWIIERPFFWEIVRLSEGERASGEHG
jgi:protein-L-isoaspartate(D-aspartate) O-methyltransferase